MGSFRDVIDERKFLHVFPKFLMNVQDNSKYIVTDLYMQKITPEKLHTSIKNAIKLRERRNKGAEGLLLKICSEVLFTIRVHREVFQQVM